MPIPAQDLAIIPAADRAAFRLTLDDSNSIHLQGLGRVPAVPASTLQVGDVLTWNYSPDATQVTKIVKETDQTIVIEETPIVLLEKPVLVEKTYIRRLRKDRLVATRKAREEWKRRWREEREKAA